MFFTATNKKTHPSKASRAGAPGSLSLRRAMNCGDGSLRSKGDCQVSSEDINRATGSQTTISVWCQRMYMFKFGTTKFPHCFNRNLSLWQGWSPDSPALLSLGCIGNSKPSSRHGSPRPLTNSSASETLAMPGDIHCEASVCDVGPSGSNGTIPVDQARKLTALG